MDISKTKILIQRTMQVLCLCQFTNNIQNFFNNTVADILLLLLEKERKKSFQFTQSFACTRNSQKELTKHGSQVYFLIKFQHETIYKWPLFLGFGCFILVLKKNPNFFPSIFLVDDDFEFMYVLIYNLDAMILSLLT